MPTHGTIREKVPLYLQLASVMRRKVETGEWRDGSALPSFEKLASKFEVARVTVRQAIATLEAEGLVKRRRRHMEQYGKRCRYICSSQA